MLIQNFRFRFQATANNALVEYRKSDDTGATVHADDALVDTIKASAAPDSSETAIVVQQLVPQDPLWTVDLQHGQLTAETLGRFAPADGIVAHLDGRYGVPLCRIKHSACCSCEQSVFFVL